MSHRDSNQQIPTREPDLWQWIGERIDAEGFLKILLNTEQSEVSFGDNISIPSAPIPVMKFYDTDSDIPIWYYFGNWVNASGAEHSLTKILTEGGDILITEDGKNILV